MQRAIDTVDAIREMTGAWVIAIHHSGHSDKSRARGSIVLRGAADTEYRMGRLNTGGDTLLESTKMKDGAKPPLMSFRFRSEEHTSELQSLMRISYAVFCLKKKKTKQN